MTIETLNQVLLVVHFLGLAFGFSVPIANAVVGALIASAAPAERSVLARLPPRMGAIGKIGLTLLWISGGVLVETRWGGFGTLPWQFHVKLTAVVLLTITVIYIHLQERRVRHGDTGASARIQTAGKIGAVFALTALVFAVLTFD